MFLQSSSMDETRIRELWNEIEQEKVEKEREKGRYDTWLEERAEKKIQLERQWRRNYGQKLPIEVEAPKSSQEETVDAAQQQAGTSSPSPLLTSLLKSSQANQTPIQPSNTARSAPTITNLLTGSSSTSSNSPSLITQSPTNAQIITASVSVGSLVKNAAINHSASSVQIPASQSAPTLITLLDKKPPVSSASQDSSVNEKQQMMMSISVPETSGGKDDGKDEDADILADFNELIAEKFDDDYLEDITSIIQSEIIDGKMAEDEPIKDVDDSSQATSTDDYDKLKIKQLVEDFAGIPIEPSQATEVICQEVPTTSAILENEIIHVQSEPETSNPPSIEMVGPTDSNDSKEESTADDKVMIISDESSNTNDEKKEFVEKMEAGEGEESQSVKSSLPDDVKDASGEESGKEARPFQGIQESDENSASSEKEETKPEAVYRVVDSDEDMAFEDAKEHQDESIKAEKDVEAPGKKTENISELQEMQTTKDISELEEVSRSAGSIDSDDEVLEVKVSRSGRKKALENIKLETPKSTTRSRDHSENDDTRDSPLIRTRSRRSSAAPVATSDSKPSFNFPKEQDHSMWKARWEDCQKELQKLKDFSSIVDNKLFQEDSYKSVVLRPMNMKQINKNIENHVSTMPIDVKRDFALMCTNVMMDSRKGSKFYETIQHFMDEALKIIESHMEVGDAYKSYRKQIKKKN